MPVAAVAADSRVPGGCDMQSVMVGDGDVVVFTRSFAELLLLCAWPRSVVHATDILDDLCNSSALYTIGRPMTFSAFRLMYTVLDKALLKRQLCQ